jgi:predicted acylesterase/phospholipase RssA
VKNKVSWENIVRPGFLEHFQESVETHVFADDVRMIDALLASSAIPVVFSPVKIGNDEFVDLVHFGAIPARQLHAIHSPDVVIATDTNPRYGYLRRFLPAPWREFMERGHREIEADLEACDVVIEPRMPAPIFRFDRARDFIASGQAAAEKQLPHIRLVLDDGHERLGKAHA